MTGDSKIPLGPALLIIFPGILILSFFMSLLFPERNKTLAQATVALILALLAALLTDLIQR
jgi:hypothetical protein